jgi:metal-responsive CopG/Arc/MetJ family transcriptional regulator
MERINLPLPAELLAAIDRMRGDVPRTVWIRRAIEQRLASEASDGSRS